jgi:hypothetical protein
MNSLKYLKFKLNTKNYFGKDKNKTTKTITKNKIKLNTRLVFCYFNFIIRLKLFKRSKHL